jgi:uncharacterized protein
MIFLLPPSETKQLGGQNYESSLSFPKLAPARSRVFQDLMQLCQDSESAAKALKLGPKQLGEVAHNLALPKAKTMPAIERYTGVLYDALKSSGLNEKALKRSGRQVYIQSALFGLISATDLIPYYRLSAESKLPASSLKEIWTNAHQGVWEDFRKQPLVDMRSKSYADLAPIPDNFPSYSLSVALEDKHGERKQLNHFNKKAKGILVAEVLRSTKQVTNLAELKAAAKAAGMRLEAKGSQLLLITYG